MIGKDAFDSLQVSESGKACSAGSGGGVSLPPGWQRHEGVINDY